MAPTDSEDWAFQSPFNPDEGEVTERVVEEDDGTPQTRGREHPDGFSFLREPNDFWKTWLQFTSQELFRLNFLKWKVKKGLVEIG